MIRSVGQVLPSLECSGKTPYRLCRNALRHDLAFKFFGGRTAEIVYDQDRVMAVSENAGDLILTEAFQSYCRYAGFKVRLCRGYDPESKGKIEAVVKYVKNNFLPGWTYFGLERLNGDGLKRLERVGNAKIHDTTKMVPARVFAEEQRTLKPVPTLSEPPEPNVAAVRKTNVVHYKQNRYEVPRGSYRPGRQALLDPDSETGKLRISDTQTGEILAEHAILFGYSLSRNKFDYRFNISAKRRFAALPKGKKVSLPRNAERYRETKYDDLKSMISQRFSGNPQIDGYLDRIREIFPRYVRDQYAIIIKAMKSYSRTELDAALSYCVERDLHSAPYLRETLLYFRGRQLSASAQKHLALPDKYENVRTQERRFDVYDSLLGEGAAQ